MKFNINIIDIIIFTLVIYIFFNFKNNKERYSDTEKAEIRSLVKEIYQVDVQAIKNLGDLSKNILENDQILNLPYNVKITGNLEVDNNTRTNNIYVNDKAEIRNSLDIKDEAGTHVKLEKNGWNSAKGTIWVGDSGTPKVVMSALSGRIPREYLKINDAGITIKGGTNITNTGINTSSISASATSNIGPFRLTEDGSNAYLQTSKPNLRISKNPINGGNLNNIKFDLNNSVKYDFNHDSFRSYVPQINFEKNMLFLVTSEFRDNNNNTNEHTLFKLSRPEEGKYVLLDNTKLSFNDDLESVLPAISLGESLTHAIENNKPMLEYINRPSEKKSQYFNQAASDNGTSTDNNVKLFILPPMKTSGWSGHLKSLAQNIT